MGTVALGVRRLREPGQVEGVAEYIRRRVEGYEGDVILHYRSGKCERAQYDLERSPPVSVESFHAVALEIDDEMRGHTGRVTIPVEAGRFGKPRYTTFEPFDAIPRR